MIFSMTVPTLKTLSANLTSILLDGLFWYCLLDYTVGKLGFYFFMSPIFKDSMETIRLKKNSKRRLLGQVLFVFEKDPAKLIHKVGS